MISYDIHTPTQHINIPHVSLDNNYTRNIPNDGFVGFSRIISIRGIFPIVNDSSQIGTIRGAFSNAEGGHRF